MCMCHLQSSDQQEINLSSETGSPPRPDSALPSQCHTALHPARAHSPWKPRFSSFTPTEHVRLAAVPPLQDTPSCSVVSVTCLERFTTSLSSLLPQLSGSFLDGVSMVPKIKAKKKKKKNQPFLSKIYSVIIHCFSKGQPKVEAGLLQREKKNG